MPLSLTFDIIFDVISLDGNEIHIKRKLLEIGKLFVIINEAFKRNEEVCGDFCAYLSCRFFLSAENIIDFRFAHRYCPVKRNTVLFLKKSSQFFSVCPLFSFPLYYS